MDACTVEGASDALRKADPFLSRDPHSLDSQPEQFQRYDAQPAALLQPA
jgi:hypothetical protein